MKSEDENDPVERALEDLARERIEDLAAELSGGAPKDDADLRAAFLRHMEDPVGEPGSAQETGTDGAYGAAGSPQVHRWARSWGGFAAAALALLLGSVAWFQLGAGAERVVDDRFGPAMGVGTESDERVKAKGWDGSTVTLQLDGGDSGLSPGFAYRVEILAGDIRVYGPEYSFKKDFKATLPAEAKSVPELMVIVTLMETSSEYTEAGDQWRLPIPNDLFEGN